MSRLTAVQWTLTVIVSGALFGCGPTVHVRQLGEHPGFAARTPAEKIQLFDSKTPTCPFTEVARVTVRGVVRWDDATRRLRARAHALGADALVRVSEGIAPSPGGDSSVDTLGGTAIRFNDPECTT